MEEVAHNDELSARLAELWSLLSTSDPAHVERLIASAETLAAGQGQPEPRAA